VQFGVALPNFQFGAPPTRQHLLAVARAAETEGYTSVFTSDHILVPAAFPRYGTIYESLTTLAWLAGQTHRIRLGTSILVLPMRNAILAAKQAATVDDLSGGRFILGVAAGWNEGEFRNVAADFAHRGRLLDESLQVVRNLWTAERPSFAGASYRYDDTLFSPKPAQPGGPPIWVGGNSEAAVRRAATYGDGWHGDEVMPDDFARTVETLRATSSQQGRRVTPSVRFTVDMLQATGAARTQERLAGHVMGDTAEIGMKGSFAGMVEFVRRYRDMGATDFVCQFEHNTEQQHVEFVRTFAREVIAKV
jgi:probable F420-dependent oxidoreductase